MLRRCSEARPKMPISLRTTVQGGETARSLTLTLTLKSLTLTLTQVLRARRHPRHLC